MNLRVKVLFKPILLVCCSLFFSLSAAAQTNAKAFELKSADFGSINIFNHVRLYTGDIQDINGLLHADSTEFIGYSHGAFTELPDTVWIVGTIKRLDTTIRSILVSACEQVKYVEFYVEQNNSLELMDIDSAFRPMAQRRYPMRSHYFDLNFTQDQERFFMKACIVANAVKGHYFHVNIHEQDSFVYKLLNRLGLQSFYTGVLAILILIALFMAAQFKEWLMVRYALFAASLGMYFILQSGLGMVAIPVLERMGDYFNLNLFVSLIFLSGCAFLVKQLSLKSRWPILYKSFVIYTLITSFYAGFYRHIPLLAQAYNFFNILSLVWVILILFIVILAFVKKQENALITLVSMALLMVGALIYLLGIMQIIPQTKFGTQSFQLGAIGFALALLYGLFLRIRQIEMSKAMALTAQQKSDELLFNVLPKEVANELKESGKSEARSIGNVSILFTDFKGFTKTSEEMSPEELVEELHQCFKAFDEIVHQFGLEKIKTIGDSYMAAGGLNSEDKNSATNTVLAAIEMSRFVSERYAEQHSAGEQSFKMRVGVHTGKVVAGIVGIKKFQYDIWGDTVNTASRMESNSEVGKVNVSQATYELIVDDPRFTFEHRGKVNVKGKGEVEMYFVNRIDQ